MPIPTETIRNNCKHAKLFRPVSQTGLEINPRGVTIISESDLYRSIIRSNLPDAEKFQDWVVEEVLPSIRKTGVYVAGEERLETEEELSLRVMRMLHQKVEVQKVMIAQQQRVIAEQQPRVEAADAFLSTGKTWFIDRVARSSPRGTWHHLATRTL